MFWILAGVAGLIVTTPMFKRWWRPHHRPRAVRLLPLRTRPDEAALGELRVHMRRCEIPVIGDVKRFWGSDSPLPDAQEPE